jgi:hypothetical protein
VYIQQLHRSIITVIAIGLLLQMCFQTEAALLLRYQSNAARGSAADALLILDEFHPKTLSRAAALERIPASTLLALKQKSCRRCTIPRDTTVAYNLLRPARGRFDNQYASVIEPSVSVIVVLT